VLSAPSPRYANWISQRKSCITVANPARNYYVFYSNTFSTYEGYHLFSFKKIRIGWCLQHTPACQKLPGDAISA
jgi:hypothetical protein